MTPRDLESHAPRDLGGGSAGDLSAAKVEYLIELPQEFGSAVELDQVLQSVAAGLRTHVDYDTLAVLLLDDLGRELYFRFAVGYPDEVVKNWRFGLGQGIVGATVQRGQPVRVGDVSTDFRYISATPELRSEMAVPLMVKNRTIGVLDLGSRECDHFDEADEKFVKLLAGHVANGIENARLYARVRNQARRLSLLHQSSRELTSILDRKELLGKVAELVKHLIDYQLFSVMLWNEEAQLLEHVFSLGSDAGFRKKDGLPLGHGVTGTAAALRQSLRVPNVHLNPHYVDIGHGVEVRSELAVPLVFKDRLIGVLDLESTEYNAFSEQHEQLLSTLASYVAVALENARLYAKVREDEQRLETDLDLAREVQRGLLPGAVPAVPCLDLGFVYRPARQLGGDFYDFLPYGEDRLAVVVGDVSGKGTPAALYASIAVGILRGLVVEQRAAPAAMLERVNAHLVQHRADNRYAAMTFAVYDARERRLMLANAGFPRPLLFRDGRVEIVRAEGVPLGMFPDVQHATLEIELGPGDVVVLCSDGVWEWPIGAREEFGTRQLQARLRGLVHLPAQGIADGLAAAAERYVADGSREPDDRTAVVLKVL